VMMLFRYVPPLQSPGGKADEQDFAAEKARQTEADAPTTKNTALPGWVRLFPSSFSSSSSRPTS